jgi:hypothetical protein
VVLQDGDFRTDAFLDVTRSLGEVGVASVREAALREFTQGVKTYGWQFDPTADPSAGKFIDAWQVQRKRVQEVRGPLSTGEALRVLLDVTDADERRQLIELDRMLANMLPHSALALGGREGYLMWFFNWRRPTAEAAAESTLTRCNDSGSVMCRVALQDGEFRADGFLAMTTMLGARDVASVREGMMRSVARELKRWQEQIIGEAAAAATQPASALAIPGR